MDKYISVEAAKQALTGWETDPTDDEIIEALDAIPAANVEPVVNAVWEFYRNDENKARWRCSACGKICKVTPYEKRRCSICGAHIKLQA